MLTNGLPTDLNFSMPANKAMVLEVAVELPNASGDELLGYTFAGEVTGADGTTYAIEGAVSDSAQNLVQLHLPSLAEGTYKYALAATGQTGMSEAFLAGTIGVWWAAIEEQTEPIKTPNSRCTVRLPEVGRGMAHWQLTERVEVAAIEAERQALKAKSWAQMAEEAANSVSGSVQVRLLSEVNAALKEFDIKVSNAVQVNTLTNTWWIGGKDTKVQVTGDDGEMGFSPYISSLGNWVAWDEQRQQAVDTGVRAYGKDGIDGTAVRRVLINSVDELPKVPANEAEAEKHRSYFYMIPTGDGYDVYGLLETANGTFAWVNVGDSNAIATATLYGLAKLGTASIVNGAPVGVNASGGLATPAANVGDYGTVKLSYDSIPDNTNCIGLSPSGQLQVNKARLGSYGVVRLGSALGQVADIPYLVSVGSIESGDNEGKLANNLLIGGALKHMRTGSGNDGWNEDTVHGASFDSLHSNTFYLGLLLSSSFSQNRTDGLVLNPATLSTLGGVKIAYSLDAPGTDTVPIASQVKKGIADKITEALANYYPKSEVYTKEEVEQAINSAYDSIVAEVLGSLAVETTASDYAGITPKKDVLYLIPEE